MSIVHDYAAIRARRDELGGELPAKAEWTAQSDATEWMRGVTLAYCSQVDSWAVPYPDASLWQVSGLPCDPGGLVEITVTMGASVDEAPEPSPEDTIKTLISCEGLTFEAYRRLHDRLGYRSYGETD